MLVKYYGVIPDAKQVLHPRSELLTNGMFRITQPKFLNDKGSEAKLFPYFNEFSPADIAWARKRYDLMQKDRSYEPSKDELENLFLKPMGIRYGEAFPHMVKQQTKFNTLDDYDKDQFIKSVEKMNSYIIEALSCNIGILSLSKTDNNENMWTHYASEGKGIAITFKKEHLFFLQNPALDVSYTPEKRATLTYYKGSIRINGEPLKNFLSDSCEEYSLNILDLMMKGVDIQNLSERLLFSKAENWVIENEARIIFELKHSDLTKGKLITPNIEDSIKELNPKIFNDYPEICLKKIPFSALDSLVFGYSIDPIAQENILRQVNSNPELSHLRIKKAKHNIYGKIDIVDFHT